MVSFYNVSQKIVLTKNTIKLIERKAESSDYNLDNKIVGGSFNLFEMDSQERMGGKFLWNYEKKDIEETRHEERQKYYSKRKSQIIDLVNCNQFETFLTVTFEKDLTDSEIKKEWTKIAKRIERCTGEKLQYICRIEKGHKGTERNHLHLIMNVPFLDNNSKYLHIKKSNSQRTTKLNKNWNKDKILEVIKNTRNNPALKAIRQEMYEEGNSLLKVICACGHVKINKISSKNKVVSYVAKYITKDIEQSEKGKRIIWTTKGLEKPVQIVNPNLIKYILENHISRIKMYSGCSYVIENEFIISETWTYAVKDLYYQMKDINLLYENDKKLQLIKKDKKYNMNSSSKIVRGSYHSLNKAFEEIPQLELRRIKYIDRMGGYQRYINLLEKRKVKNKIKEVLQYEIKW